MHNSWDTTRSTSESSCSVTEANFMREPMLYNLPTVARIPSAVCFTVFPMWTSQTSKSKRPFGQWLSTWWQKWRAAGKFEDPRSDLKTSRNLSAAPSNA